MKLFQMPVISVSTGLMQLMLGVAVLLFAAGTHAQEQDPSSRVARISYTEGSVSVQIADSDDWIEAHINRPLTSHDQIVTGGGARTELQMGMATLHLDENTQMGILELSDNVMQLQLSQGVVNLSVRGMDDDETIEIDTPNVSVSIPEPGNYRIEVNGDDETVVKVRNGSADVAGERQRYTVQENEQLRLAGIDRLNAQFDDLDHMDDFDRWAASRNSRVSDSSAARYVDDNVIGYEDLDNYGYWGWEADYGNVWFPTSVGHGWSPYRFGHWDWISPWGWTWVDDEPWGFAPFHYGRWAQIHRRWCWVPGPRGQHAVYAPALVAWVGAPGVSISAGIGSVGWVPLGPHEIYRPHYTASAGYLARVNLSNSLLNRAEFDRDFHDDHHHEQFVNRGAAIAVPADVFTSARDVRRHLKPVNPGTWQRIDNLSSLRPGKPALLGNAAVVKRPPNVVERPAVAQRKPAPFVPRPEFPQQRNASPNEPVRLIVPFQQRRVAGGHNNDHAPPPVNPPANRSEGVDDHRADHSHDNWRDRNPGMQNQPHQPNYPGDNTHREWRNRPPVQQQQVAPPNTNQPRVNPPPVQPQQQEPERRRVGPWINQEQQLRPQPPAVQPRVNPPPPAPAPRVQPPRNPPPPAPPHNNSQPDGRDDHPRQLQERREIR
ncbi:MAG: DUF6600 domain-containing protein [Steroidobacter sp.]